MKFNAKEQVDNVVKFIQEYYDKHSLGGAVVGLSGGKDSAVVLALLVKALGKENVVAVSLPCHSIKKDRSLAKVVADAFEVQLFNHDITKAFDVFTKSLIKGYGKVNKDCLLNSDINLKPRLRMASLYYYSAMMTSLKNTPYLVVGTGNKCEQYVGYFTKGGDGVCDISLLADFTVEEVIKLGEVLNVPKEVLYRAPSDGISSMTDEENLGVTYAEIASVLNGENKVSKEHKAKIEKLHKNSLHKFNVPTYRREK